MRRCLPAILAFAAVGLSACAVKAEPFDLTFSVFPTADGADILVEIHGGPTGEAWFGFGVGPGADPRIIDRVHSIEARSIDGQRLALTPYGESGFRVDGPAGSWKLGYSLDLRPESDEDIFYRASSRGEDYLVLVGSDAWARFYETSQSLAYSPANRPAGFVEHARVNFSLPEMPERWRVATTARELTSSSFELQEHPLGSVFALGPFELSDTPDRAVRLAMHRDWDVMRNDIQAMTADLADSLRHRVGANADAPALALLSPLPRPLQPQGGLRTAGMVRGETMILYASLSDHAASDRDRLSEAVAVFLGHELFHLYLPSAVPVTRDLSWLSEGWAMHMGRLAARDAGWLTADAGERRLREAYRQYLDIGGYRAGSLPEASMGSESQRDLLYLRGELVFRLLDAEWRRAGHDRDFETALWAALSTAYDGQTPLDSVRVRKILASLVEPSTVRRYVEGRAPLTPAALGLGTR